MVNYGKANNSTPNLKIAEYPPKKSLMYTEEEKQTKIPKHTLCFSFRWKAIMCDDFNSK